MTLSTGCDVSVWQTYFDPSKATDVIDFAFEKATDGVSIHSAFETMWLGVRQCQVRGAYHYQRNGNWQVQADKFLHTTNTKDFHVLALDVEGYGNVVDDVFLLDSKRIIEYLQTKTTKRVILYTNISYYKQMQGLGLNTWLETVPLWIAYPNHKPGYPGLPPSRTSWTFHQYSWTGTGIRWGTKGNTDENVYNGTIEQLKQWANVTTPPPTGESPMTIIGTAKSNTHILTVRNLHQVTGSIALTKIPLGTAVNVSEIWKAPATTPTNSINDLWALVTYGSVTGWIGLVHFGVTYGIYTPAPVIVPPPPTDEGLKVNYTSLETFPLENRIRWTVRRNNGETVFIDYPI